MKNKYITLLVALTSFFSATSQNYNITFQVDMNTVDPATFTTPEVNGTFNGWCGNCAAMTDANGDNIWDVTISMAAGSYEFKFSADNWGIQESLLPGSPCTVTNFGFTNRILNVSGDTTLSAVCWESCDDCASGPTAYDVTFEVDMRGVTQPYTTPEVNGDFNGWCGNCWQMTDADGDSIWQFQMLFAPGDSLEWKYSADNWNIQEDLDSSLSCIIINYDPGAPNGYGFVNRVAVVNSDTTFSSPWNLCTSLLSVPGCTDSTALNYNPLATIDDSSCIYCVYGCMDSLACNYDPAATCDDGSCLSIYGCTDSLATNYDPLATCEDSTCVYGYYVTFQLDLRGVTSITYTTPEVNGMFNGWCGSCNPLEDLDGDSIWETTLLIDPGTYEYKYSVDNFTTEENLFAGDSCTVSNFGFTNRTITVDRDTVLAPVCWELCGDCDSGPSSYNVTFRLDMSEYVGPPYTTPEVNGTFNNWCGSCWAMEDPDGDNVWEFTALIGAGDSIQFKYSADNWNIQEELDSSLSCVFVGFDPGAPNGWGYVNRLEVIDSEKVLDVVCWQECVECQGTSSLGESPTGNLLLYPNPSTGSVIIRSPENISRCTVYSVLGEIISSEEMGESTNEHKINIAKNGLYYVSIHTEKGVFTNKITIQN